MFARKQGEKIVIGTGPDAIVITLVSHDNGRARIGIDAPKHVQIDRAEVREQKDNEAAARAKPR